MKVVFASATEQSPLGGAEVSSWLLKSELQKKNVEIRLLSIDRVEKSEKNSEIFLIPIRWVPTKLLYIGNAFLDLLIGYHSRKYLEKNPADLIHIQDIYILPGVLEAARKLKIPTIVTVRDNVPRLPVFSNNKIYKTMATLSYIHRSQAIKKALKNADMIIAISEHIKNNLIALGISSEKIKVIYNIPPNWSCENKTEEKIIFSAGRLKEEKGFDVLIRAFSLVAEKLPDFNLEIAGSGPDYARLEKLIHKLNLNGRAQLIGKLKYDEMRTMYCKSSVVVMPSLYPEPLGRIPIEGMSAGKPIITAATGGAVELVKDGFNGFIYAPGDYLQLADRLLELCKDKKLRAEFGLNGKKFLAQKLDKEQITYKTLELYNQ